MFRSPFIYAASIFFLIASTDALHEMPPIGKVVMAKPMFTSGKNIGPGANNQHPYIVTGHLQPGHVELHCMTKSPLYATIPLADVGIPYLKGNVRLTPVTADIRHVYEPKSDDFKVHVGNIGMNRLNAAAAWHIHSEVADGHMREVEKQYANSRHLRNKGERKGAHISRIRADMHADAAALHRGLSEKHKKASQDPNAPFSPETLQSIKDGSAANKLLNDAHEKDYALGDVDKNVQDAHKMRLEALDYVPVPPVHHQKK